MVDLKMFEKDPITGKKKYIKGSWRKMFRVDWKVLLVVFVVVFNFYMYNPVTQECKEAISNPCNYCRESVFNYNNGLHFVVPNESGLNTSVSQPPNFSAVYDPITKDRFGFNETIN